MRCCLNSTDMTVPPVVVIAFNRPQFVEPMLERLRDVKPSQLFLICDGPREGHPTDAERTAAVRAAFDDGIDWPCDVHRVYSEVNGGCDATIERGLDFVFEHVDRAIILEDDCQADPTFFRYAEELLDRYADDERVAQIAGNSLAVPERAFGENSYGFSPYSAVWGWATWARAWHRHRSFFPRRHEPDAPRGPLGEIPYWTEVPRNDAFVTTSGRRYFKDAAEHGADYNWDTHWWVTMGHYGWLSATPLVNMVTNVGFGIEDSTHVTGSTRTLPGAEPMTFPLHHPADVAVDLEVARELELVLVRANSRLARRMRRLVPNGPLRTAARYLATGPVTVAVMRLVSRALSRLRGR